MAVVWFLSVVAELHFFSHHRKTRPDGCFLNLSINMQLFNSLFMRLILLAMASLLCPALSAQNSFAVENTPVGWKVFNGKGTVFITPYSANIVEVTFSKNGLPVADSSHAVILRPQPVLRSVTVVPGKGSVLSAGDMQIVVTGNPFRLTFVYRGDTILREAGGFKVEPGISSASFLMAKGEQIYGTGERAIPLNRRGYELPLYNRPNYGYGVGATSLNYSIPLVLSSKKYALLWDNPQKGSVDVGKTDEEILSWNSMGGTARYFVAAAGDYPDGCSSRENSRIPAGTPGHCPAF